MPLVTGGEAMAIACRKTTAQNPGKILEKGKPTPAKFGSNRVNVINILLLDYGLLSILLSCYLNQATKNGTRILRILTDQHGFIRIIRSDPSNPCTILCCFALDVALLLSARAIYRSQDTTGVVSFHSNQPQITVKFRFHR